MKAYGEVEIQFNNFLNSVPEGGKWSSIRGTPRLQGNLRNTDGEYVEGGLSYHGI